jgi:hypothetical protein
MGSTPWSINEEKGTSNKEKGMSNTKQGTRNENCTRTRHQ